MLPIAGKTAGPNGLKFFWTLTDSRGCLRLKKSEIVFFKFNFFLNILNLFSSTGYARPFSLVILLTLILTYFLIPFPFTKRFSNNKLNLFYINIDSNPTYIIEQTKTKTFLMFIAIVITAQCAVNMYQI